MSFLDYVLASFGVYEIKDVPKKMPRQKEVRTKEICSSSFSPTKETISQQKSSSQMAYFCPKTTQQVVEIAKFLATNQPMVVDTKFLPQNLLRSSLDFLCGAKTALEANLKRLENGLFVFTPKNTNFVEFLEEE